MTDENLAYEFSFHAVELIAASQRIDFGNLHNRYRPGAAVTLLRSTAATNLKQARQLDRETAQKVWRRHRKQIA